MERHIEGLFTALITPFNERGEVDVEGLRRLITQQLEAEVEGILVLGTTGEGASLTAEERDLVIKTAVKEVNGDTAVMVGCGTHNTLQTISNINRASDFGADYALVVTPYYVKPPQDGIYQHFATIAQSAQIPLVLYDNPGRTGQGITAKTVQRLTALPKIVGIKDASANEKQLADLVSVTQAPFSIMCGNDESTLPSIACGSCGCISVISNLLPREMKLLVDQATSGNLGEARKMHHYLLPLMRALGWESNPIPLKAAMRLCSLPSGGVRLPLSDLNADHIPGLREVLKRYDETLSPGMR